VVRGDQIARDIVGSGGEEMQLVMDPLYDLSSERLVHLIRRIIVKAC
jgi:hypothetical protein